MDEILLANEYESKKIQKENIELKKRISSLWSDLENEQDQRIKFENLNKELNENILRLNNELTKYKEEFRNLREENDKLLCLSEENENLKNSSTSIQKKYNALKQNFEENVTNLAVSEHHIRDLEENVSNMAQEIYVKNNSMLELQADYLKLEKVIIEKDEQLKSFKEVIEELSNKENYFESHLDVSNRTLPTKDIFEPNCSNMNLAAEMKITELNSQLDDMLQSWLSPGDAEKLTLQCENLQTKLTDSHFKAKVEAERLEQRKIEAENKLQKSLLNIESKEKQIKLLTSEVDNLKSKLDSVNKILVSFRVRCADLANLNNKFAKENKELKEVSLSNKKVSGFATSLFEGFPSLEEPDPPITFHECSLERIAELQKRNSKQLAHLKSSYPTETQGSTPSRCDEAIRIGDPNETLQRISTVSSAFSKENKFGFNKTTKAFHDSCERIKQIVQTTNNTSDCSNIHDEHQPSVMFEIPFTPQKNLKQVETKKMISTLSKSKSQHTVPSRLIKTKHKMKSSEGKAAKKGRFPLGQVNMKN